MPTPQVHASIARAARATGVDFTYLLGEAQLESSFNPNARAPTSSAAGLYQFTGGTWLQTLDRHGAKHGLGWAGAAIAGGRITDPAQRHTIMDLRFDPDAAALMAGELANDNRLTLTAALGRAPDSNELYLAHFLGADSASRFLSALAANPGQSAANLFPAAAAANRVIFYEASGASRSLNGVMGLIRDKLGQAMNGLPTDINPADWAEVTRVGGLGSGANPSAVHAAFSEPPPRPSMADTLAATFGTGSNSQTPPHVVAAYGKFQAFGL